MNKIFKKGINYFSVFIAVFLFFSFLQMPEVLPDPDSFYHARITQILGTGEIVKEFPHLNFTTLNDGYIDHHFFYHLLIVPFVKIFDPLVGVKIAQLFITSFFVLFFYWFLKQEKIKWPLFWTLLLVLNSPFVFRALLIKANSFSLLFLFAGLYFIFNKKYWPLFVLSYFYVFSYGGWPLIVLVSLIYVFSRWLSDKIMVNKLISGWKGFWQKVVKKKNVLTKENSKIFFSVLNGVALGVFINPYFPKNLYFYFQQVVQIGIINYKDKINVGGEWSSYQILDLLANNGIVFVFFFLALTLFLVSFKKQNSKSLTLFFLSLVFLIATLKSRRYVEYLIPFLIFFSAFSFTYFHKDKLFEFIRKNVLSFYVKSRVEFFVVISVLIWAFVFVSFGDVLTTRKDLSLGSSFNLYLGAGQYLEKNSKPGEIVFHGDWDDFPPLFYHAPNNYYIVGLDPTFMYNHDESLYKEYEEITMGIDRVNLHKKIKNDFNAKYVFLDRDHLNFNDNLISDSGFDLVYKDQESFIYKVK